MDIQEIEDRAGLPSGVGRQQLAEEFGCSEQTLSRLLKSGSIQNWVVPALLEQRGEFTEKGLAFVRALLSVGNGENGPALGKARSSFITQSRKDPEFVSLYRAYRYQVQEYSVFPAEVCEDDAEPIPDVRGELARYQQGMMANREMPANADFFRAVALEGEESIAEKLAAAAAAIQYHRVYAATSRSLQQASTSALEEAVRDHERALAEQIRAQATP